MLFGLVALWSARLTWNWARGFSHVRHEDWRYVRLQEQTGAFYWPVSFLGIHMMPTVVVFLGCLPLYVAATAGPVPFGLLDCVATFVVAAAIWLESESDQQLVRYRESKPASESFLSSGLWAHLRHPNYLGEIGFWWGLYLFGVAANPSAWWTIAGPLSITLLFRGVTVSMIDGRMQERRPDYAAHQIVRVRRFPESTTDTSLVYTNGPAFSATGLEVEARYRSAAGGAASEWQSGPSGTEVFATYALVRGSGENEDAASAPFRFVPDHTLTLGIARGIGPFVASGLVEYRSSTDGPVATISGQERIDLNLGYRHRYREAELLHFVSLDNVTDSELAVPEYVRRNINVIVDGFGRSLSYVLRVRF